MIRERRYERANNWVVFGDEYERLMEVLRFSRLPLFGHAVRSLYAQNTGGWTVNWHSDDPLLEQQEGREEERWWSMHWRFHGGLYDIVVYEGWLVLNPLETTLLRRADSCWLLKKTAADWGPRGGPRVQSSAWRSSWSRHFKIWALHVTFYRIHLFSRYGINTFLMCALPEYSCVDYYCLRRCTCSCCLSSRPQIIGVLAFDANYFYVRRRKHSKPLHTMFAYLYWQRCSHEAGKVGWDEERHILREAW